MQIYLPIAEMAVQAETLIALGAVVGFFSGLFGIGGGFLMTPFLIFMGIPPVVAVGTQSTQLCATAASGVMAYWRRKNVDLKMGGIMIAGGMIGIIFGMIVFTLLQKSGQIDLVISVLYVVFLGGTGSLMMGESIRSYLNTGKGKEDKLPLLQRSKTLGKLPYKMRFDQSRLYMSALIPASIGLIAGLMVSVLGIGAGFMIVPVMIYLLGMPPSVVAGTSLFQLLAISAFAAIMHAVTNQTLDITLAFILIIGSVIGTQFGVRAARLIRGRIARLLLATIILLIALKLGADLLIQPLSLYTVETIR